MRINALTGALLLAAGLVVGCIFSPDKGDPNKPPPPPPELTTPVGVLNALRIAYENRDSSGYRKLFEVDYQGQTYDTSDADGNQPAVFTRIDEERHIKKLAEDPNITSVSLDLGLQGTWVQSRIISDTNPPEEWAHITLKNPQIGFMDGANPIQTVANETFEFSFRPTYAPESSTDTLWHIVRWLESP